MQKSTNCKSKKQPLFYFVKNQKSKKAPKDASKSYQANISYFKNQLKNAKNILQNNKKATLLLSDFFLPKKSNKKRA